MQTVFVAILAIVLLGLIVAVVIGALIRSDAQSGAIPLEHVAAVARENGRLSLTATAASLSEVAADPSGLPTPANAQQAADLDQFRVAAAELSGLIAAQAATIEPMRRD